MKTGLPRHFTVIPWPSARGVRSTSTVESARTEASGFIWEMKGQIAATPPTAAMAPVAIKMKSRLVGSEESVAVMRGGFLPWNLGEKPAQRADPVRVSGIGTIESLAIKCRSDGVRSSMPEIALYQPDIAPNVGTILRL